MIKDLSFQHLIIQRLTAFLDPELYLYIESIGLFEDQFATGWFLTLFSRTFRFDNLYKIWDVLLIENINVIYLFICFILKENKTYIMTNTKETIIKDFSEICDFIKIDLIIIEVLKIYKSIPHSLLPISNEYNEETLKELKQSEYFKNRWWDLENFNINKYIVPIISLHDILMIYDRIIFVDIRLQQEYDNLKVTNSLHLSLTKNKYYDNCISQLEKNNGSKIIVLIGNKNSNFKDCIYHLLKKKIKLITILQGGIDVIYVDEYSLIVKK